MRAKLTNCKRCGDPGVGTKSASTGRPFRRALRGYCTACIVIRFFQGEEDGVGFALSPQFDPEGLRLPHVQAQFARVLEVGHSELTIDEIDWDKVIAKWAPGVGWPS